MTQEMPVKKNLHTKLQKIKTELVKSGLTKTGRNSYSNFEYFELQDFLPTIIDLCEKHGVCTYPSYGRELASLTAVNSDNPNESITITSPMVEAEIKGCNKIQALGGTQTYLRRYLYMALFDITERDMFDGATKEPKQAVTGKITPAQIKMFERLKITPKKPIETLTYAEAVAMINQAYKLIAETKKGKAKQETTKETTTANEL
jgi:hypothetical protein